MIATIDRERVILDEGAPSTAPLPRIPGGELWVHSGRPIPARELLAREGIELHVTPRPWRKQFWLAILAAVALALVVLTVRAVLSLAFDPVFPEPSLTRDVPTLPYTIPGRP